MAASPLLQAFDQQAAWCAGQAPFTARVVARSRAWLAEEAAAHAALVSVDADPLAAAVALRWAAGLHHLALQGLAPWAALWPPADPGLSADALDRALDAAIRAAWREQQPALQAALALPPQTNEVQRSAALLPGLLHVAARTGLPLTLLEIGASAGLNLWLDRYRHDHGAWAWGSPAAPLTLRSDWRGPTPACIEAGTDLHIARRAACDGHPINLAHPAAGLHLASFIWPDQRERLARLAAACTAVARWQQAEGVIVEAMSAADFVRRELAAFAPGQATVLMHSVVWQYIAPQEQAAIRALIAAAAARATAASPLAWLRFEPPGADKDQGKGGVELRCHCWPDGGDTLLARCHPHGAWTHWLADGSAGEPGAAADAGKAAE